MVLGREGVVGSIGLVGLALVSIVDFPTQVYLSTTGKGLTESPRVVLSLSWVEILNLKVVGTV